MPEAGEGCGLSRAEQLGHTNGASHSELKIAPDGRIMLIEIGGRMGGDFIGSDLVYLSTGFDFVKAVIQIALGERLECSVGQTGAAAVRFVLGPEDILSFHRIREEHPGDYCTAEYDRAF